MMKSFIGLLSGMILGALLVMMFNTETFSGAGDEDVVNERLPLYWVAPMDPNYRRDKPGKSPMGMDLVPVYEDAVQDSPGTIEIAPEVVNNLGVRTTKVRQGVLSIPITTVGNVQYDENQLVHIHPRVEGWIDKLFINAAGERVQQGQPLYALYSPELVNAQEELILALSRGNKTLIAAAKSRLKALQMPEASLHKLLSEQQVQQTVVFYAPRSGVVERLEVREGFYVKPGNNILSIGALDSVWVEAAIYERQSLLVTQGLPASITLDFYPGRIWQGHIDYVYSTLDDISRTARVRITLPNTDEKLKPGMFATVKIATQVKQETLLLDTDAVIRTAAQNRVVLALGNGRFKSVAVEIGHSANGQTQILSGLEEGDPVVLSAQFLLDSESSIDSDFRRISATSNDTQQLHHEGHDMHSMEVSPAQQATTTGTVNRTDSDTRIVNISRAGIPKWNRGPATMDFTVAEHLDMSHLSPAAQLEFTFEIRGGDFVVTDFSVISGGHQHD